MPIYKVKPGQTLYDVAVNIYGTIEGLFDLIITNSDKNMMSDLKAGDELEYHEEYILQQAIAKQIGDKKIKIANGSNNTIPSTFNEMPKIILKVNSSEDSISLNMIGQGAMIIDWGDLSPTKEHTFEINREEHFTHNFENVDEEHVVRIYGDFSLTLFQLNDCDCNVFVTRNINVGTFISDGGNIELPGISLFDGLSDIYIQGAQNLDLRQILPLKWTLLDLRTSTFSADFSLADFLQTILDGDGWDGYKILNVSSNVVDDRVLSLFSQLLASQHFNPEGESEIYIDNELYQA